MLGICAPSKMSAYLELIIGRINTGCIVLLCSWKLFEECCLRKLFGGRCIPKLASCHETASLLKVRLQKHWAYIFRLGSSPINARLSMWGMPQSAIGCNPSLYKCLHCMSLIAMEFRATKGDQKPLLSIAGLFCYKLQVSEEKCLNAHPHKMFL